MGYKAQLVVRTSEPDAALLIEEIRTLANDSARTISAVAVEYFELGKAAKENELMTYKHFLDKLEEEGSMVVTQDYLEQLEKRDEAFTKWLEKANVEAESLEEIKQDPQSKTKPSEKEKGEVDQGKCVEESLQPGTSKTDASNGNKKKEGQQKELKNEKSLEAEEDDMSLSDSEKSNQNEELPFNQAPSTTSGSENDAGTQTNEGDFSDYQDDLPTPTLARRVRDTTRQVARERRRQIVAENKQFVENIVELFETEGIAAAAEALAKQYKKYTPVEGGEIRRVLKLRLSAAQAEEIYEAALGFKEYRSYQERLLFGTDALA